MDLENEMTPTEWLEANSTPSESDLQEQAIEDREEAESLERVAAQEKEDSEQGEKDQKADTEMEKVKAAITTKFGGAAEGILKTLSDEQALALGAQLAADQKKISDQAAILGRLKKAEGLSEADEDGTSGQADAGDSAESSEEVGGYQEATGLDLTEVLGTLDPDIYGDDLPKALTAISDKLTEHTNAQVEARVSGLVDQLNGMVDGDVRRQLAERFPNLQDPEYAQKVDAKMVELSSGMTYEDPADTRANRMKLMEHALVVVDPNAFLESKSKPRRKGGPVPPQRKPSQTARKRTPDEEKLAFLRDRDRGVELSVARRNLTS